MSSIRNALVFSMLVSISVSDASAASCGPAQVPQASVKLWRSTLERYLEDPLWMPRDNYDATNVLMLPLHCALEYCKAPGIFKEAFDQFFRRFDAAWVSQLDDNPLREAQFLYLVSQYVAVSAEVGEWDDTRLQLFIKLGRYLDHSWNARPAPHWAHKDFTGVGARIAWKLNVQATEKRYFRGVIDEEFFVLSIGADLKRASNALGIEASPLVDQVLEAGIEVLEREGRFDQFGRWLMQPGVWSDHRDYIFAGNQELVAGLQPRVVEGLSMDSSHAHRMGLWLLGFVKAAKGSAKHDLLQEIAAGHRKQVIEVAFQAPGTEFEWPVLTNFLDGSNGIYRYSYQTVREKLGYGPYQLSYALLYGWFAYLESEEIAAGYEWFHSRFPLEDPIVDFYLGPDTTRERHELVSGKAFFVDGLGELLVRLAAMRSRYRACS